MRHVNENRKKVFDRLDENSFAVLFAGKSKHKTSDQYYDFEVNRNFYYLTNLSKEKMILVLTKSGNCNSYLFIEENTELKEKWDGKRITKEKCSELSGINIKNIKYLHELDSFILSLINNREGINYQNLYLDLFRAYVYGDITVINEVFDYAEMIKKDYPELSINNIEKHFKYLRMFKSEYEVAEIQKAINVTKEGIEAIFSNIKNCQYEYQAESYFTQRLNYNKMTKSFVSIAASGKNACVLHYVDNNCKLNDGDLLLFDAGAQHNNYAADITRTFPVNGKFTSRQAEIYQIVLDANKVVIKQLKPGMTVKEATEIARKILVEGAKKIGLIKEDSEIGKYFFHNVGHHLGLDVHDLADYSQKLSEGMVFTVEPGLYVKEESIGIRIEDDVLITKDGAINLSADIIKEIDEIENYFKNIK